MFKSCYFQSSILLHFTKGNDKYTEAFTDVSFLICLLIFVGFYFENEIQEKDIFSIYVQQQIAYLMKTMF